MKINTLVKRGQKIFKFALFLFLVAGIVFPYPLQIKKAEAATGQVIQTSQADFQAGTVDSSLDANQAPGDLRLKYKTESQEDTSDTDFNLGNTKSDTSMSNVSSDDGGKITINQGYIYNSDTSPKLGSNYVYNSFIDSDRNLLYISTYRGGLAVINTKGTNDSADDTLVTTYTDSTNPAIGSNFVYHAFLDSSRNLLYVSTISWDGDGDGGLSVINTQGTIDPGDDILVKTYTTTTSPAIASNSVYHSFLDSARNLLYISTQGSGLSVINTQGTVDPADDTLVKTYTTGTTPAIATNYPYNSFLDSTHNLLYVSTLCTGDPCVNGGLSVINTQGTVDPADDTLVKKYDSSSTPAIGISSAINTFLDSSRNLLYVSTGGGGLSVINTQGTVDPADDTLVKTYTTSTSPAIVGNYIDHSFLDSANNLVYISTTNGLSVINTQGTVSATDDTLVKNYTTSTSPAIEYNNVYHAFLDSDTGLLHVDTYGAHSVVDINEQYNPKGVYLKDSPVENDVWEQKTSMSVARTAAASGVIDGKIYISSGVDNTWTKQASLEAYEPESDSWATKTSMSVARVGSSSAVANRKLYVVGGRDQARNFLSSLEVYNPDNNTWETKASMSTARISAAAAALENKLYVIGGQGADGMPLATLEVYDPESNTWETKAPMSQIRSQGQTVQAIDGKLYVVGGGYLDGGYPPFLKSLEVYDPATDTWETKASMPQTRAGLISIVLNGKMVVFGGTNDDWYPVGDAFIYDPQTDSWSKFTDLSLPLHRTTAQVVNGDLYIIGGKNYDYDSTSDVYKLPATYLTDNYQKESYAQLNWDSTTPAGTSVELLYSLNSGKTYESLGTEEGTHYLPPNSAYSLRYKAILSTSDTSITPSLNSVELKYAQGSSGLYESSQGTYTSPVLDSEDSVNWENITAEAETLAGTSITYQTRTGDTETPDSTWSSWEDANSSITSPDSRYIQYQAAFTTTDQSQTPVLKGIALNYSTSSFKPTIHIGKDKTYSLSANETVSLKNQTLTFRGKIPSLKKGDIVQIYEDGKLKKNVKIKKNLRWSYKIKPKRNQIHTFQFRYLEKNTKDEILTSPEYSILIDKLKPRITNLPKTITARVGDTITWGTTENDQIDHYQITFRGVKSTTSEPSFQIPEGTPTGTSRLTVRAYDRAENMAKRRVKVRVE